MGQRRHTCRDPSIERIADGKGWGAEAELPEVPRCAVIRENAFIKTIIHHFKPPRVIYIYMCDLRFLVSRDEDKMSNIRVRTVSRSDLNEENLLTLVRDGWLPIPESIIPPERRNFLWDTLDIQHHD